MKMNKQELLYFSPRETEKRVRWIMRAFKDKPELSRLIELELIKIRENGYFLNQIHILKKYEGCKQYFQCNPLNSSGYCCLEEAKECMLKYLELHGFNRKLFKIVSFKRIAIEESVAWQYCLVFRVKTPEELRIFSDRPKCPECGSKHVISRGKEWYCRDCGKYWSKIKRKAEKRV